MNCDHQEAVGTSELCFQALYEAQNSVLAIPSQYPDLSSHYWTLQRPNLTGVTAADRTNPACVLGL